MLKATIKDKELITEILYQAFVDITIPNSINFVVNQDEKRKKRLRFLMEYLFLTTIEFGDIFISDNKKACVLISYPHLQKTTIKNIVLKIKLALKTIGLTNVFKVLKREQQLSKQHITEPHIHPVIMGVTKAHQGKGTGVRLIKEVFNFYKDNKLPCILETTTEENIKMYEKFGFKIVKESNDLNYPLFFLRKDF